MSLTVSCIKATEYHNPKEVFDLLESILPGSIETENELKHCHAFVCGNKVAAAVKTESNIIDKTYTILEVVVGREFRGTDVTKAVKDFITSKSNNYTVLALISTVNLRSLNFFYSMGFRAVDSLPNYYQFDEGKKGDAIVVQLSNKIKYNPKYEVDDFVDNL